MLLHLPISLDNLEVGKPELLYSSYYDMGSPFSLEI